MPLSPPRCGLIIVDSMRSVPLQGISVDVQVKGFVADVSATLKYKNEEEKVVEVIFVFPMDEDSAVYSFEATVEGKTIVADLQEKKEASDIASIGHMAIVQLSPIQMNGAELQYQEMYSTLMAHKTYDDAIRQGQQAFLLEENEDSSDVFTCSVGNLPPSQMAEVTIKYVQEVPIEADGAVRIVLPAILNPRYTPADHNVSVTATRPLLPLEKIPYTLSVCAHFQSAYGIAKIESNCDISPVEYTNESKTAAKLSLAEGHEFDRDVEFLAYYIEVYKPFVAVEVGLNSELAEPGSFMSDPVVMLSLFPNFLTPHEEETGGEFIFLMDQSGSMNSPISSELNAPRRIQSAKETLILLLKSLPLGCYFNIYGFGSTFSSFFMESLEYTQESMEEAVEKVYMMNANFGGTEILLPLRKIYSSGKQEHSRQVFIFTDGEVGNTREVIKEVRKNSHNHRCFTFGIGEGASTALIKGMARAGGGTYDFITGKDRMQSKVLRSLKCALQPSVRDVSLTWNLPPGLEASVLSKVPTTIFQGQRSIIYSQLKGNMVKGSVGGRVSLQYKLKGETIINAYNFPLNLRNVERPTIHRLAAKSLISTLEYGVDSDSEEVKKRILETSLQSCVISSLTAFVAVIKDTKIPVEGPPLRWDLPSSAFGFTGFSSGSGFRLGVASSGTLFGNSNFSSTGGLFGSSGNSSIGNFTFGQAPPAVQCAFGSASPSGSLFGSHNITCLAPQSFGGSQSTGMMAFGSAPPSVPPTFGTTFSSGSTGSVLFGSAPIAGSIGFGSTPCSGSSTFGSAASSGAFLFGSVPPLGNIDESEGSTHMKLILLQRADGSWSPSMEIANILGISARDLQDKNPDQGMDLSVWTTLLAVIWLHSNCDAQKDEWELLSRKAVTWIKLKTGSSLNHWVSAGITLLKSSVDIAVLGL